MGVSSSAPKSTQSQSQVTTQVDRRVAASDNAVIANEGSRVGTTDLSVGGDLSVQSLDPEAIAGAFGLTEETARQLAQLAGAVAHDSSLVAGNANQVVGDTAQTAIEANALVSGNANTILGETAQNAFGLSQGVVDKFSELASQVVQGGQNLAERLSGETTATVERVGDAYGRQLYDLATTQATGGASEGNKVVLALIVAGAVVWLFGGKKSA